jgi:uncharacterized protein (TIGR02217 family)
VVDFIEERLLEKVAFGTESGVEYKTLVAELKSGASRRTSVWARPLDRFSVIYKVLRPIQRELVVKAFRACRGRAIGFRFKDPLDYTATNEPIGVGAGGLLEYQLKKSYVFGTVTEVREVYKPAPGKVTLNYGDAHTDVSGVTDYTTGKVQVNVPDGEIIYWTGEFDKPVCFGSDKLMWSLDTKEGGVHRLASTDIELEEIRTL